jgi:hypothetical protein
MAGMQMLVTEPSGTGALAMCDRIGPRRTEPGLPIHRESRHNDDLTTSQVCGSLGTRSVGQLHGPSRTLCGGLRSRTQESTGATADQGVPEFRCRCAVDPTRRVRPAGPFQDGSR